MPGPRRIAIHHTPAEHSPCTTWLFSSEFYLSDACSSFAVWEQSKTKFWDATIRQFPVFSYCIALPALPLFNPCQLQPSTWIQTIHFPSPPCTDSPGRTSTMRSKSSSRKFPGHDFHGRQRIKDPKTQPLWWFRQNRCDISYCTESHYYLLRLITESYRVLMLHYTTNLSIVQNTSRSSEYIESGLARSARWPKPVQTSRKNLLSTAGQFVKDHHITNSQMSQIVVDSEVEAFILSYMSSSSHDLGVAE